VIRADPPKRRAVLLTTLDDIDLWMTAPADQALKLQRRCRTGAVDRCDREPRMRE